MLNSLKQLVSSFSHIPAWMRVYALTHAGAYLLHRTARRLMSTGVNPTMDLATSIFKSLVWDNLVKAGIAALFVYMPWLNNWFTGPIVKFIINKFAESMFTASSLFVDMTTIKILNVEHQKAVDQASEQLLILAKDKGITSDAFKAEQVKQATALSNLTVFTQ